MEREARRPAESLGKSQSRCGHDCRPAPHASSPASLRLARSRIRRPTARKRGWGGGGGGGSSLRPRPREGPGRLGRPASRAAAGSSVSAGLYHVTRLLFLHGGVRALPVPRPASWTPALCNDAVGVPRFRAQPRSESSGSHRSRASPFKFQQRASWKSIRPWWVRDGS